MTWSSRSPVRNPSESSQTGEDTESVYQGTRESLLSFLQAQVRETLNAGVPIVST